MVRFDANLLTTTTDTSLTLRPADAYYRVVAVDANGNRSGPSDFAEAPRPMIASEPVSQASVGQRYEYQLQSNASIGDLRTTGSGTAFWDAEQTVYSMPRGPEWLTVDAATGLLIGTPTAPGRDEVVIEAGIEGSEHVGTQRYVIDVRP